MATLSFYLSLIVLIASSSATTLCFVSYGTFRHRSALWLAVCLSGLSLFALAVLVVQVGGMSLSPGRTRGPAGPDLLWQALGSILVAHALPRFLLSAFGSAPGGCRYRLLDAATGVVAALCAVRVATGWGGPTKVATLPNDILRIFLFTLIGGSFVLTIVFQSRLPDRSLYKVVIGQIAALIVLLPFVILEDLASLVVSGFPNLAGELLILAASLSAVLHARRSLMRPKYLAGDVPSPFFAERFGISERELDVVSGVLEGLGNNEIAERLFISPRTVEKHLYNIYQKAGIKNRVQLFNLLRSDAR